MHHISCNSCGQPTPGGKGPALMRHAAPVVCAPGHSLLLARRACAKQESGRMTEAAAQEISAGLRAGIGSDRPCGAKLQTRSSVCGEGIISPGPGWGCFLEKYGVRGGAGLVAWWLGGFVAVSVGLRLRLSRPTP
jgi:hypothetical protein